MQTRSSSVYEHSSPTKKPLLRMLWWESVAPFGNPVVPDVYWMLIGSSKLSPARIVRQHRPVAGGQRLPLRVAEEDDRAQLRTAVAHLGDHRPVVARLERRRGHQQRDPGLVEHVLQLVGPVRRVDVDQDRADVGGRVLQDHPLPPVRRPDADPVALAHTGRDQPGRERLDRVEQLGVAEPAAGAAVDQRLTVAEAGHGVPQVVADRLAEQRDGRGAARVRPGHGQSQLYGSLASFGRSSADGCT